jgi:hypothetical protein
MATRLRRELGYEDHARIPADARRHEILDGELYVTPAPPPTHQRLAKRLQRRDWPGLVTDLGARWR